MNWKVIWSKTWTFINTVNLPAKYKAYAPTIVQHSLIEWHSHNTTSAIRSSPLGSYSLNHVTLHAKPWMVSWVSVKLVLTSNFYQAITLKQCRDLTYILPFPSDTHIRASTTSSIYLPYSPASRWVSVSSVRGGCFSSGAVAGVVLQQLQLQRCEHKYLMDTTHKVLIPKHLSQPHPTRALMSVSNPLFHHTCRNLLSVKAIHLHTNVVSALYSGVAATHASITHVQAKHFSTYTHTRAMNFSAPMAMNRLRTFLHMHSGLWTFQHLRRTTSYIYVTSPATLTLDSDLNLLRHVCRLRITSPELLW